MSKPGKGVSPSDIGRFIEELSNEAEKTKPSKKSESTGHKRKNTREERAILKNVEEKNENWRKDIEQNYTKQTIREILDKAESEGISLYATIDEELHEIISEFLNLKNKNGRGNEKITTSEDEKQFLKAQTAARVFDVYEKFFVVTEEEENARKKIVKIDEKTPGITQHIFDKVLDDKVKKLSDELADMIDKLVTTKSVEQALVSEIHRESNPKIGKDPTDETPPITDTITIEKLPPSPKKGIFKRLFG